MSSRFVSSALRTPSQAARATQRPANRTDVSARPVAAVADSQKPRTSGYRRILLVVLLIVAGIFATIMINSQMAADAHRLQQETAELAQVRVDNDILRNQLKTAQSAPQLAQKAQNLGLVPAGKSGTINLRDNAVKPGKPAGE